VAQTSLVHKKESSAYGHHDTVDDEVFVNEHSASLL